jgi:hypothetical protein
LSLYSVSCCFLSLCAEASKFDIIPPFFFKENIAQSTQNQKILTTEIHFEKCFQKLFAPKITSNTVTDFYIIVINEFASRDS